MLARKNDPSCVKMIDFGLSKDFSGQETMKTMSGSVSLLQSLFVLIESLIRFYVCLVAILHRSGSVPTELQFED